MSSAQATLFDVEAPEPFRGGCPTCHAEVLEVEVRGRLVVVEVSEVLEAFPCPNCAQVRLRGHKRSWCDRCGMSGMIGEDMPLRGVAIDQLGNARTYRRSGRDSGREDGEAVHLLHSCIQV